LLMQVEVGPVRVLHSVFAEVVNNCFGLNLHCFHTFSPTFVKLEQINFSGLHVYNFKINETNSFIKK